MLAEEPMMLRFIGNDDAVSSLSFLNDFILLVLLRLLLPIHKLPA